MLTVGGWRWNRFGVGTYFLDAGRGVVAVATPDRAATDREGWRYRATGLQRRRVQLVRERDGVEVLGLESDWSGSGPVEGIPGGYLRRSGPAAVHVTGRGGEELLRFTRDPDPDTGATVWLGPGLAPAEAVPLSAFVWLLVRNESGGTVSVGEPRQVRRLGR